MFRATHGTRLISPVPGAALGTCNIARYLFNEYRSKNFDVPTHPPHMNYMSWAGAQLKELRDAPNCGNDTKSRYIWTPSSRCHRKMYIYAK